MTNGNVQRGLNDTNNWIALPSIDIAEARGAINEKLLSELNLRLRVTLLITAFLVLGAATMSGSVAEAGGLLFISVGSFFFGVMTGFLYSTFGSEKEKFSPVATTVTSLITGALAIDLTKTDQSLAYQFLKVMAHASGVSGNKAVGTVLTVSIAMGTIGFLMMYFNRILMLNVEMNVTSQLTESISRSRAVLQKVRIDPSPESPSASPMALQAAREIISNPLAGKSNKAGELVADTKAFYAYGEYDRAQDAARRALEVRQQDPEAMLYLAAAILGDDADMNEKKAAEAAKILERLVRMDTGPAIASKLLGYCYLYLSDGPQGAEKLKKSIELTQSYLASQAPKGQPRDLGSVLNLACAYGQLGPDQQDHLIPLLRELVASDPNAAARLRALPDFAKWRDNPAFNEVVPLPQN